MSDLTRAGLEALLGMAFLVALGGTFLLAAALRRARAELAAARVRAEDLEGRRAFWERVAQEDGARIRAVREALRVFPDAPKRAPDPLRPDA